MLLSVRYILAAALGLAAIACALPPIDYAGAPTLRLLDTLLLQETDSVYLGKPEQSFAVDDSGAIYVPDGFWNRVVRFRRDGTLDRIFGKAGDGPGEFRSLTSATIVLDSVLIQPTPTKLKVFDRFGGRYLFQHSVRRSLIDQIALDGDSVYIGCFDFATGLGVLASTRHALLHPEPPALLSSLQANMVASPPELDAYPGLRNAAGIAVAAWHDSLVTGFTGLDYLVRRTRDGKPVDSIWIPHKVRKGAREALDQFFARGRHHDIKSEAEAISYLIRVWRVSNGALLTWHQDNSVTSPDGRNYLFSGRAFLSVIRPDGRSACVDATLPFPGSEWPRLAMHGDTLYALDQLPSPTDSMRASTVVRRYLVETARCRWLPTAML